MTKDFCGSVRVGTTVPSIGEMVLSVAADMQSDAAAVNATKKSFFIVIFLQGYIISVLE